MRVLKGQFLHVVKQTGQDQTGLESSSKEIWGAEELALPPKLTRSVLTALSTLGAINQV